MFFFSFISYRLGHNIELDFPCESPIDTSSDYHKMEPVPNMSLRQVIVLTRHGARAPVDSYNAHETEDWYCDDEPLGEEQEPAWAPRYSAVGGNIHRRNHMKYDKDQLRFKPSCQSGGLITQGMKQHHDLGAFFRRLYYDEYKFLPYKYDSKYIFVRSSEVDRCQRSAMSFLSGLYPSLTPDETIVYETGTPALEMLHPQTSQCQDLKDAWDRWVKSPQYQARKEYSTPFLKPLADSVGIDFYENEATWMFIGDWMGTIACTNHSFPDSVNETVLEVGMKAVEYYSHGFFSSSRGIAGSVIMREIIRIIENKIAGKTETKFALLSAHDVSIVAALILLGYDNSHWSPFRSYFITELWEDAENQLYLRFIYNSQPVAVDFMDHETVVKLTKFRSRVAPYLDYCHEFP